MVEDEKKLMENIKNFDLSKLFMSKTYIDFEINNSLVPSFINRIESDGRYNIVFQDNGSNVNAPKHMLKYYGENNYSNDYKLRKYIISSEIPYWEIPKIKNFIHEKLKILDINLPEEINSSEKESENSNKQLNLFNLNKEEPKSKNILIDDKGYECDITGYLTYQFLQGNLLDCIFLIKKHLENEESLNFNTKELLEIILDIIIYVSDIIKSNLKYYKAAYYNRKLLIISQIHAILASYDSLIINLTEIYNYANNTYVDLNKKLNKLINSIYQIILLSKESFSIPLQSLIIFIKLITFPKAKIRIDNFDTNEVYLILKDHMKNLDKNDLIFFKSDSSIKESCNKLINELFNEDMEVKMNEIYYSYLFSCLKCDNLEKKINALNEINNIINNEFYKNKKINPIFKDFIGKNNILDIFFDESTHEEIIKRAGDLFGYLAKFNCLNDTFIEKIIEKQKNNNLMKDILIEIVSELPVEKKDALFKRLSEGIKLDDTNANNIEYISRLTSSCFSSTKIRHSSKEKNSEQIVKMIEEKSNNNYYGLNLIFEYIIYNFDDKKGYKENNIDKAIIHFENTIKDIGDNSLFGVEDIQFFLDKLFENIKSNEKHNSIIQSIKLIYKLLITISKRFGENFENVLKNLDGKYDIITLLINDLIRYLNISENYIEDNIYEGIYSHNINIEQRLTLIFYFLKKNLDFMIEGKKHLEKLYQIFKPEKFKEERRIFNEIMTSCIEKLSNTLLIEFYRDILQNKEEFDLTKVNDSESINLIIQIFKQINLNKKTILNDGRIIRVEEDAEIEGTNMLFTLLTQNSDDDIQEEVSELLCQICLYQKNYTSIKLPDYWENYFNKINIYLDEITISNDKIALNGIIKLINKIYTKCQNMEGKIINKFDRAVKGKNREYHFINMNNKKEYKIRAGINEKFINLRYRVSYYFDIPVNNVCLIDKNDNKFNLNNDFENFVSLFSEEQYFYKKGYEYIRVKIIPFKIGNIKNNPKILIEKNEKIYDILINNLKCDLNEENESNDNKDIIWNTLLKLPKNFYFNNHLKKYGEKEIINEEELHKVFNIKEIYLFTYYLKCLENFLFNKEINDIERDDYIDNFINIHHIDNIITNNFLNFSLNSHNCKKIQIEFLLIIINIIYKIEEHKKTSIESDDNKSEKCDEHLNNIFKKLTEIISILLILNYASSDDCLKNSKDSCSEVINENLENDISNLVKLIFIVINYISNDRKLYINLMFKNPENFIKIFIKDFIRCKSNELKAIIDNYFFQNFAQNASIFKTYLNIVLTEELFNYFILNDNLGKYFGIISSIIQRYLSKNKFDSSSNPEFIEKCKRLIDLIINHMNELIEKSDKKFESKQVENLLNIISEKEQSKLFINSEKYKEKLFQILSNIINLQPQELAIYLINKVDFCNYFLIKCILRKCVQKPLEIPDSFCRNNVSKISDYDLIVNVLKYLDNENFNKLYMEIINILDNYHKIGFWKTYNVRNWYIEFEEMFKEKYIGLKNMTSTCYLNSIIQQLYMIPTLRETIIKIDNPYKNNVLYELQLLFSALKIYDNSYYDPRSFVIANNLSFIEQMDADEFYVTLIDKIEKDIKDIYSIKDKNKIIEDKKDNYKYKDLFKYFFGINVLDELQFVDCEHKRYNEFCYYNIQLEIKNFSNINESLKNYFKEEVMDGDNKINCEQCNTKRICHKHLLLKSLPNILVICLKRFEFDYETMLKYKLNKYFEFPFNLNLKDYMIENHTEQSTEYELTGIVIHNGISDFGHYYDIIKSPDNKWYKFNDENVFEFKEEDIPNEAFGNKYYDDIEDEDDDRGKGNGKKNAYILFYTKKIAVDNKNLEKYELALPPYSKYSNIKKENIDKINLKLYKSWIIRNIFSPWYQTFISNLFDVCQKKKKMKMLELKSELEEEKDDITEKDITSDEDEIDDKVFKFFLRYYFNILIRIQKKEDKDATEQYQNFEQKLFNYIKSDINKAKYILEEFSNTEALDEFLTYCPCNNVHNICVLIKESFAVLYHHSDMSNQNNFLYKYINTLMTYIAKNIASINLNQAVTVMVQIININSSMIMNYFKKKDIDIWANSLFTNEDKEEVFNHVFNEANMPTVHSTHSILIEKTMTPKEKYENLKIKRPEDEKNIFDQKFFNNLQDLQSNNHFASQLKNFL